MQYQIIHGDCLQEMENLPANSVDAIVTDPPYELAFMGKSWDAQGVSFQPETWSACLRVLKPGGHMLCFGGSRTFHRIAVAIEDAGFELRDTVMWVYGCLSEDTEILTIDGWVRFDSPTLNSPVVCYNSINGAFEAHIATRRYVYDNKHPAYHIKSNLTDQIVSRNHRVAVEREGKIIFEYAENLREMENIPILEGLHSLPETIYDFHKGTSIEKQELLKRVQWATNLNYEEREVKADRAEGIQSDNLCSMPQEGMEAKCLDKESVSSHMQSEVQWCIEGFGMEESCTQGASCMEKGIGGSAKGKNDRRSEPSLEGWGNILQNTWKLCWSKVCSLSKRIFSNGKKRWVCYGTSVTDSNRAGATTAANRSSASYKSQPYGQQHIKPNVIFEQQEPQSIRGMQQITLATISPIEYKGKVWCVEVPTGAFVARRNGQVFITGNSGFPKSHDISKAIDKAAGGEREVICRNENSRENCTKANTLYESGTVGKTAYITAPATDAAKQWQGWGTALKPAFEPIILARKPVEGTVAANVLKWGTGAINIDGCRVGTDEVLVHHNVQSGNGIYGEYGSFESRPHQGRWPANFIHDGSEEVLELMPNDSARFYYSPKASKKDRDEGCEGLEEVPRFRGGLGGASIPLKGSPMPLARNNHPTVKPTSLMRYLCRLITPPNGTILDPFMGSGSTGKAAMLEGFNFIGIEREQEYVEIAEERIEYARKNRSDILDDDIRDETDGDPTLFNCV